MNDEVKQFIRPEIVRALELRFTLLVVNARVRRGLRGVRDERRTVTVSSQYEPVEQEHQRWPAGAFKRLQMLAAVEEAQLRSTRVAMILALNRARGFFEVEDDAEG